MFMKAAQLALFMRALSLKGSDNELLECFLDMRFATTARWRSFSYVPIVAFSLKSGCICTEPHLLPAV